MAHAYTPGLKVVANTIVRRERRLPLAGEVLVKAGDVVKGTDVVARTFLPGNVETVNVANKLGMPPEEVPKFMVAQQGAQVAENQVIAEMKQLFGLFSSKATSPVAGTIETISAVTGQVIVREPPLAVSVTAYIDGEIVRVHGSVGVDVQCIGTFVQGIFGIGGETHGDIAIVAAGPDDIVESDRFGAELADQIVVAGSLVTGEVYERAAAIGIAALVCGGFHDRDLRRLLGYDLGVAITGHEEIKPILIITEGFGCIAMAEATFRLLQAHAGEHASANGATQIRAGVLRPEIIIPATGARAATDAEESMPMGLTEGSPVRIIREPGFGRIGVVKALPAGVVEIESEAKVRVAEVELPDGSTATVPRANLEAIER